MLKVGREPKSNMLNLIFSHIFKVFVTPVFEKGNNNLCENRRRNSPSLHSWNIFKKIILNKLGKKQGYSQMTGSAGSDPMEKQQIKFLLQGKWWKSQWKEKWNAIITFWILKVLLTLSDWKNYGRWCGRLRFARRLLTLLRGCITKQNVL